MFVLWIFLSILSTSATQDELLITQKDGGSCDGCDETDTLRSFGYSHYGKIYEDYGDYDYNYNAEDIDMNNDIEKLIFEYIEKASTAPYQECIPIISQYTNCINDNIHTGCKRCICDSFGRWNCADVRCVTDSPLSLDSKTLSAVIENLGNYKKLYSNDRLKRSVSEVFDKKKIKYEDILKWIYGVHNFEVQSDKYLNTKTNIEDNSSTASEFDNDLLVFKDILANVHQNKNDNITKQRSHSEALFYNNIDPILSDIINEIDNYYVTEANERKVSTNSTSDASITSESTHIYPIDGVNVIFDEMMKKNEETNRSLKKRDISNTNETIATLNYNNTIDEVDALQRNVLTSLNKILDDKQNELEKLTSVKDKLIFHIKSFGSVNISNNISNNVTNNSKEEEQSNIYLYQFEVDQEENFRRHGPNLLEKYLIKLKKDIYEVVRDIAGIQRINASIPTNLKALTRAMKYYINKESRDKKLSDTKLKKNFRRVYDVEYKNEENIPLNIIIHMLDIINNYEPTGLKFVSLDARNIVYRIIKAFSTDKIPVSITRGFDSKYDILTNLKYIGSKWQNLELNSTSIELHERLHILKFIYAQLSKDICKLNDILMTLEFAYSRRTAPVNEAVSKKVVFQITNDLNQINSLINSIVKIKTKENLKNKNFVSKIGKVKDDATGIKKSLFQKIKKLLKSSKKEMRDLFRRKVPKSEIVKHIANKKMNEINKKKISEYDEIMQRWQNNINMKSTRSKRSTREVQKYMKKIKHIIPRYLRGKVRPAIDKNKRNKTRVHATTRKTKGKSKQMKENKSRMNRN